ncbi:hypothetical protein JR316_0010989 [Psilocybe cubensis]|uniref:Uncharacterized protein n=2 Tax=Psilocybe cubensis TaxID=181762 RepID=A0ACB8GNF4_PSICU|nr:hypothetical protein JR316_0010989 [Psilocybe cubensis]KAH9477073.1 hypothetical protein JR316_0010989 [Psilocybe cubensis]
METLPRYAEGQLPQSAFDAMLIRIAGRLSSTVPEAHAVLASFVEGQRAPSYRPENDIEPPEAIERFPQDQAIPNEVYSSNKDFDSPQLVSVKQAIVFEFFDAIFREDNETISLLIQHNIVTANTTSKSGKTPLLEAISANHLTVVKQLLEMGADPNAFGEIQETCELNIIRTPLMLAASSGSLPLVKLLFEAPHSANDSLIAPDGQIALRLAADNGHRAIVEYLPSRRGGNYLRFKVKNAENIERAKKALESIYYFVEFFVWELPIFFLWSIPKYLVVIPVVDTCKYCWSKRKVFGSWCKRQAVEVPKRIWRTVKKVPKAIEIVGKSAWKAVKMVPKAIELAGKRIWKFATVTLPEQLKYLLKWLWILVTQRFPKAIFDFIKWICEVIKKIPTVIADALVTLEKWLKALATWTWDLIVTRIPNATAIALKWMWTGIKASAQAVWDAILKFLSFLHTIVSAIASFLRKVTLMDIVHAFCDLLSAVFIKIPKTVWSWVKELGLVSRSIMEALFKSFGLLIWNICAFILTQLMRIPKSLLHILQSFANAVAVGGHEIRVWINPKAL